MKKILLLITLILLVVGCSEKVYTIDDLKNNGFIVKPHTLILENPDLVSFKNAEMYEGEYIFQDTFGTRLLNVPSLIVYNSIDIAKKEQEESNEKLKNNSEDYFDNLLRELTIEGYKNSYTCNINNLVIFFFYEELKNMSFGSNEKICEIVKSGF